MKTIKKYLTLFLAFLCISSFSQSIFYKGQNCNLRLNLFGYNYITGYAYKNGIHYLVWSNGSDRDKCRDTLYSNYDNYVKLSTSSDGLNWTTKNIINTSFGSYNHRITIDNNGYIHITYTDVTEIQYYGSCNANVVYATNKSGNWEKQNVVNGSGGYTYYASDLIAIGSDGKISVFYHSDEWWVYGSPLLVKKYNGSTWGNEIIVSNNGTRNLYDDRENIFQAYDYEDGKLVLYVSSGFQMERSTPYIHLNKIFKIAENGDNYKLVQTYFNVRDVNVSNGNILKVSADQKSLYLNDILVYNNNLIIENPHLNNDGLYISFMNSNDSYILKKVDTKFQLVDILYNKSCILINNLIFTYSLMSENPKILWINTLDKNSLISQVSPQLTLSTISLNSGNTLTLIGRSFTPNSTAQLSFSSGTSITVNTDIYGQFTYNYTVPTSISGVQTLKAIDVKTGLTSNVKQFLINSTTLQTTNLTISSPLQSITVAENEKFQLEWKDKMVLGKSYTMSGAKRNYKYIIELSDNNGSTWKTLNSVEGLAYIDSWVTLNFTTSIASSGNGYTIRIRDFYNSSNSQITPVITVGQATVTGNLKTELNWDYSYPQTDREVMGVAADGTARIFLNLSKINSSLGSQISSVKVSLSDDSNGSDPTKLGKVIVATQTSVYGSEANGVTTITATDNTTNKANYIFWYVAPDDYTGADPEDIKYSFRHVNATFTVNYSNGTTETKQKQITIVRPPLMLVHGLASDANTWDNFCHDEMGYKMPFIKDFRFKTCKAVNIQPDASFKVNASQLVFGTNDPNSNSFQSVISDLRNQGYAANRVDYVCHSMGGCVLRSIFDNYYPDFTRTENASNRNFKNYERGYVNKVIMIGTPNNGSPWADIINRYSGDLSCNLRTEIQAWYGWAKEKPLPLMFLQPIDNKGSICFSIPTVTTVFYKKWEFKPSDAVKDLLIDKTKGGVAFRATNTKAHLIAGDIFPGTQFDTNGLIPQDIVYIVKNTGDEMLQDILNYFLKIAISKELETELKKILTKILQSNLTPTGKALAFFDKMALVMDVYNTGTFIPESDLVVSVGSQLAGYPRPSSNSNSNVSVIDDFVSHSIFPGSETKNTAIGNQVYYLLNRSINSSSFDVIPATSYRNNIIKKSKEIGLGINNLNDNPIITKIDTSKIQIISPKSNINIYVDSILNVQLSIKDTNNLKSVELKFQNKTYYVDSLFVGTIDFEMQINSNSLDNQIIQMEGFYSYPDSGVFVYDIINVNIITNDTLIDFGLSSKILYLFEDQIKIPEYYAIYNHNIATGNLSSEIKAVVNDTSIVEFDTISNSFKGKASGETFAIISYKGFSDTLYLVVHETINDSTQNQTDIPVVSIKNKDNQSILIYPNPTKGQFTLEFENLSQNNGEVIINNLLGQVISTMNIVGKLSILDISNQPNGIYFVRFRDKFGKENTKKIQKI